MRAIVSSSLAKMKKRKIRIDKTKRVKTVYNCSRMINLDIRERLFINAFLSIFQFFSNFSAFLLPIICLFLGIYYSSFHIRLFPLKCRPMIPKKKISKKKIKLKIKNCGEKNNYTSAFHLAI